MGPNWNFPEDDDHDLDPAAVRGRLGHESVASSAFWSKPFAVCLRLAAVGGALVSVTIAVLASVGPVSEPAPHIVSSTARLAPAPSLTGKASAVFAPRDVVPGIRQGTVPFGPFMPRPIAISPADLCTSLELGDRASGWAPSAVYGSEWECISMQDAGEAGGASSRSGRNKGSKAVAVKANVAPSPPAYRMFSMARGTGEDDLRYVRFKISADDMAGADAASEALGRHLAQLYAAMGWQLPEIAAFSTRLRQPFALKDEGTTLRFVKERMTEWSYNLIIEFPKAPVKLAKVAVPKDNPLKARSDAQRP